MEIACIVSSIARRSLTRQWLCPMAAGPSRLYVYVYVYILYSDSLAYGRRSCAHAHFLTCATSAKNAENIFHN